MIHATLFDPAPTWAPPTHYPTLHGVVALDTETKDRRLLQRGPGWAYPDDDGGVVGISVATAEGTAYFPIGHEGGGNLDKATTLRWLNDQLQNPALTVVAYNRLYDEGWLRRMGLQPRCQWVDTHIWAALLDENRRSYTLDDVAFDYLGLRKNEDELRALARHWQVDPKAELYRLPAWAVGAYAEQDAALTLNLYHHLLPLLAAQQLEGIAALEHALQPVLLRMRQRGVRVDVPKAEQEHARLRQREQDLTKALRTAAGRPVDAWSPESAGSALQAQGLPVPSSPTGRPSVTKEFLQAHAANPVAAGILELRRVAKLRSTFLEGYVLNMEVQGRLYGEFHSLRSDDGGAVTGRFSASHPNLENLPARDEAAMALIRGLVLPEDGAQWLAADYSQQEPRMLVHFAALSHLPGARQAVEAYRKDPHTDFHNYVRDLTGLPRKAAKDLNLAQFYGQGEASFCKAVGLPTAFIERYGKTIEVAGAEGRAMLDQYDAKLPFVRKIAQRCMQVARQRGYIRTLLGRRRRFEQPGYPQGAFPFKALNSLIQGSSADQLKDAMVAVDAAYPHFLHVPVHDELGGSVWSPAEVQGIVDIMVHHLTLQVPSKVDCAVGPTWGTAKEAEA